MARLDLNYYSNREILTALFELRAEKFTVLIQAMAAVIEELNKKGRLLASEQDERVDSIIRRVLKRG